VSMTVTPLFAAALAAQVKTFTYVMKVGPFRDGSYIGMTTFGRDIDYDDGTGLRTYYKKTGAQLTQLQSKNNLAVNNGNAKTLLSQYPAQGVTRAMVLDNSISGVRFAIYKINWTDTSPEMGHQHMSSGPVGEVRLSRNGMVALELRSWTDLLRQNSVIEADSITCRCKKFGSQPGDELFPCNKDISGLWVNGLVITALGIEPVRQFTVGGLANISGFFAPGLVTARSGLNDGLSREVGTHDLVAGNGVFNLRFPFPYAFEEDDIIDVRPDCTRKWGRLMPADPIELNSCLYHENHEWFRGEPKIRVGSYIALTVPGAAAGGW
jgi:hypothetical protein